MPGTLYHDRDRSWMRDFVPRPAEVTVLCVLGWLGMVLMVVIGVALVFVGPAAASAARHARGLPPGATGAAVGLLAVAGGVVVVVAILVGLLYGQLWKGRNWARITLIVFQILNLAGGLFAAMQGENVTRAVGRIGFGLIFLGLLNTPRTKEYCQQ
ncbi:MAG: hypothetical protein IT204_14550 [Fimbriimonadaceae bacterium]|nr:hypothetical protein [Fimbriimonadaceae bacterium]